MNVVDKTLATQLQNIQNRTGKSLDQLYALIRKSGLSKHGEMRELLKTELKMGHGDANTVVHCFLQAEKSKNGDVKPASIDDLLNEIYSGPKASLRPIHDKLIAAINKFGKFETAPKKNYVSLRRKKQFAMIGPATNTRVEVGLNMKGVMATSRLEQLPAGGMCQYKMRLTDAKQVDKELIDWIKTAFDSAE